MHRLDDFNHRGASASFLTPRVQLRTQTACCPHSILERQTRRRSGMQSHGPRSTPPSLLGCQVAEGLSKQTTHRGRTVIDTWELPDQSREIHLDPEFSLILNTP